MKYCKTCVNINTRPDGGGFDENGICPACKFSHGMKYKTVDFSSRRKELDEIVQWGKENTRSSYDCIVTVSGGKDSTKQAFFARDELGLKPLLVSCVYPPEQLHYRGAYNLSNLVSHGFDTVSMSLDPQTWKNVMRLAFLKYGNQAKSTEMALYAIPIHISIAYKIPLIFLGENPLYTLGQQEGKGEGGCAVGMQYSNTLEGGKPDMFLTNEITRQHLYFYRYPNDDEIEWAKLRMIYLGYYIEEWSDMNNARFAKDLGLIVRDDKPEDIGDYFGYSSLDEEFKIVNQMIKYVKFGYGNVTEQMIPAVNNGEITREQAFDLIKKYDGKCHPRYIKHFCDYLEISEKKFWEVVESYRGLHVWEKDNAGEWKLKIEEE